VAAPDPAGRFYSAGMKLQQGSIWISFGASRVLAANFRQSRAATTELRASTSAAPSYILGGRSVCQNSTASFQNCSGGSMMVACAPFGNSQSRFGPA